MLLIFRDFFKWWGHGQKLSHGPQLPTGCVDQLQDCIRRWAAKNSRAEERQCVVVPQEEACMTQTYRLSFNQEERGREKRGRGRHAGDRGEWEHTHSCNLITESSRLLPSAFKGYGHSYTQIWNQETDINTDGGRAHMQTHAHRHLNESVQRACRHPKHVFSHTLVNKRAAQWPDSLGIFKLRTYSITFPV